MLADLTQQKTKDAVSLMLDCFSGADGGVSFVNFMKLLQDIDKKAVNGDKAAQEIIRIIVSTAKFIEIAGR